MVIFPVLHDLSTIIEKTTYADEVTENLDVRRYSQIEKKCVV